ncbi:MAG: hypothetical protein DRO06_04430, partial [Thermoproteota archaeon]
AWTLLILRGRAEHLYVWAARRVLEGLPSRISYVGDQAVEGECLTALVIAASRDSSFIPAAAELLSYGEAREEAEAPGEGVSRIISLPGPEAQADEEGDGDEGG